MTDEYRKLHVNTSIFFISCILLSFCSSSMALDKVYQWRDAQGHIHFANVPPQQQDVYVLGSVNAKDAVFVPEPEKNIVGGEAPTNINVLASPAAEIPLSRLGDGKGDVKMLIQRLRQHSVATRTLKKLNAEKNSGVRLAPLAAVAKTVAPSVTARSDENSDEFNDEAALRLRQQALLPAQKESSEKERFLSKKDADKCGVFSGFVTAYKQKIREVCPGSNCTLYKNNLKKYQSKKALYC
jgi:Domain of unknown function (DUF4124)